ncbi:MAG TPA: CvpA family protein [Allosphingosinicella sp.]|nr:CvpA family protein [Allosphingosinicella sp.]
MHFTALDILVILLVGTGLVFGWLRGFVAEMLSLFAWFLAILALRLLHAPVASLLEGVVGTASGAAVLAFVLVFGLVFFAGKLASRRVGAQVRKSVVGPLDRVLGAAFGALKGLIGITLLFLAFNLVYDTIYGRRAARPEWVRDSMTYSLLKSSGTTVVDLVEAQRGPAAEGNESAGNGQ